MSASPTETKNKIRLRDSRFWVGRFTLTFGLGILTYYGYCFGLWGRNVLILQYFFQCNCPSFSEERRYPTEVDVIVSACEKASIRLSASGRLLYVNENELIFPATYLLDLQTNEKIPFSRPDLPEGDFSFLTDDLIFISDHVLDRTTNTLHPIEKYIYSHPDAYANGDADFIKLAEVLREAKDVYFIDNSTDTVVALVSDFRNHPESNFIIDKFDMPGFGTDRIELFLQEYRITYHFIPSNHLSEAIAHNGRFIARPDGIYLIETNQMIVRSYHGGVRGWTNDNRGVIYAPYYGGGGPCLIQGNLGLLDDAVCFFEVPQPVLLLKVPEEYLLSTQTP